MQDVEGLADAGGKRRAAAPVELELKLAVAPGDRGRLAQHPLLLARAHNAPPQRQRMQARYFDTACGLLAAHGMALRLRREGDAWVQTFKTSSGPALALRSRGEWERPVPGPKLDWAALAATPLAELANFAELPERLRQSFGIDFERQSWALAFKDGTRAVASLDHGDIVCGAAEDPSTVAGEGAAWRTEPIAEFELELESGNPATVWKFAERLLVDLNLVPLAISKGERGSALASHAAAQPLKSRPPELTPTHDVHAALALALGNPLAALQHNLRQLDFENPEFVHQARVALRRMRSVLRAFDRLVVDKTLRRDIDRLRGPLKQFGRTLGAARDADVFVGETLGRMAEQWKSPPPGPTGIAQQIDDVAAAAAERRRAAQAAVRAWLATPAHGRLLLAAERLVFDATQSPKREPERQEKRAKRAPPLADQLGPLLARQHEKVQHAAVALTRLGAPERHRLRIEVKRLRYLLDLAAPLWPQDASRAYRKTLAALQARLGALNDRSEAGRQLAAQRAAPVLRARWSDHEREQLAAELPRVAKQVAALDLAAVPWRAAMNA